MKIGIIGAMQQEVEPLLKVMVSKTITRYLNTEIHCGQISNHDIFLLQSGIGKTIAASNTTALLSYTPIDLVINIGTAGGTLSNMQVGDIVISRDVVYHDVDVTAFGYKIGQMPGCPALFPANKSLIDVFTSVATSNQYNIHTGLIASGDSFINDDKKLEDIKENFPDVVAIDMESAAIGHICYTNNIPFVIIRAISDAGDTNSHISFAEFLPLAAEKATNLIVQTINKLTQI